MMGQYWKCVNLDRREFIDPHKLGCGLKLYEQMDSHPGTGTALVILCAAMPKRRGGGDLDLEDNWHNPELTFPEHNDRSGPMPDDYSVVARRTIGRWVGDRIALVGDYAESEDLPMEDASIIYDLCDAESNDPNRFTDVTDDVCRVIEHELNGCFQGDGWRQFVKQEEQR